MTEENNTLEIFKDTCPVTGYRKDSKEYKKLLYNQGTIPLEDVGLSIQEELQILKAQNKADEFERHEKNREIRNGWACIFFFIAIMLILTGNPILFTISLVIGLSITIPKTTLFLGLLALIGTLSNW